MAFLPGNRQTFTVLGQCLGQRLVMGQGVEGAMKVSKAESQPDPGEENTGTLARLDLVSTLVLSFPVEHLCYFKLSVQQGKGNGKKKEENCFPFTNDSIKQISAAVRGEESGITTPAWKETLHWLHLHPTNGNGMHQTQLCWLLVVPLSSPAAWKAQYLVCSAFDF